MDSKYIDLSPSILAKAERHFKHFRLWTEEEREASLDKAMAQLNELKDLWIFGYASLVWRPDFEFVESRRGTLMGYHRALCLWSSVNRGTPERPGLVFGLAESGVCEGTVYKLPNQNLHEKMRRLWQREMPNSSYLPMWLDCITEQGTVKALAFVMDPEDPSYVGDLSLEETIEVVMGAQGHYGPCTEYVLETAEALKKANIHDEALYHLADLITQHQQDY
ncbi:MAG: gamma-glutamylcyclotransferase [Alcaligenaceae bacterium]|nr:gamma-glutamylcyclotransferase [Alcaligenaceae bacterium]